MGTGYTRNDSSNNIADGNVINASDFDGEFNAIESTMGTSGHTHDGTAAEGGPVTVTGPAQDLVISGTEVKPKTDNTLDLGTASLQFKDAYFQGTIDTDGIMTAATFEPNGDTAAGDDAAIGYTAAEGLILTGQGSTNDVTIKNDADADVIEIPTGTTNVTVAGNLGVGGTVTGTGTSVFASLDISGDIDVDGTTNLDVVDIDGAVDMASTLGVAGVVTANAGVVVDEMTLDGDTLTATGVFTIDATADIILDAGGGDILFKDDGTESGRIVSRIAGEIGFNSEVNDADIKFKGKDSDGGGTITALTLDMSEAGAATFNDKITAVGTSVFTNLDISGDIDVDGTTNLDVVDIDGAVDMASTLGVTGVVTANAGVVIDEMTIDADTLTATDDFIIDAAANIEINADGGTITFKDASASLGTITSSGYSGTSAVATTVTITDNESTNENNTVVFVAGADADGGNVGLESDGNLTYNPSTGTLSATNISVSGTLSTVDSVTMSANNAVVFEGATADAHETTLTIVDATADRTITLPNVSGTVPVLAAASNTQITSTPEELNALDGITAVVGELNALDIGSTAVGTAVASKAVILDSNKDYTGIRNLTTTGVITANAGVVVDEMTLDADTITATDDFIIDAVGDIILDADGGDLRLKDDGTEFGNLHNSGYFGVYSTISDADLKLQGNDGGSLIDALTFDMSAAGAATFNSTVTANAGVVVDNITIDGTTIALSSGHLNLDSAGQIFLDGGDDGTVQLRDAGTQYGAIYSTSGDWYFKSTQGDKDIIFQGVDGTSQITALTLDMSDGGAAHFTNDIRIKDNQAIRFGDDQDFRIFNDNNHTTLINSVSDQDILFKGNDGGSAITALTLDMSDAGAATFNNDVNVGVDLDVAGDAVIDGTALVTGVLTTTAAAVFNGGFTSNGDTVTFASANTDDPLLYLKQTGNNTTSARLYFVKDKGAAGADNDEIGKIQFIADNDAQQQTSFVKQIATIADASDGSEGGKFQIQVASHDGELVDGLVLTDGDAEDEIDVTIASGTSSNTTVSGNLAVTTQLTATGGAVSAPTYSFIGDTDTGISRPTTNAVNIVTAGEERMRIDSIGNLGLGVAPDTLSSGYRGLQINGFAYNIGHSGGDHYITNNAYFNGAWKYGQTSTAQMVELSSGQIQFKTAASGSADADITWVRSMNILSGGGVVINDDSADMDFRVETNNNTHTFFVDGGTDLIGIGGVSVPDGQFTIPSTNSDTPRIRFQHPSVTGDASIDTFQDGGGTYLAIGQNHFFAANGNSTKFNTSEEANMWYFDPSGAIVGYTATSGAGFVERMRIQSTAGKNLKVADGIDLANGNLIVAAGHGVDFSAQAASGGATAELLDHYEEGTWTPAIASNASATAYTTQVGHYTRIGSICHVSAILQISNLGSFAGAVINLTGLPFTISDATNYNPIGSLVLSGTATAKSDIFLRFTLDTILARLEQANGQVTHDNNMNANAFDTGTILKMSGSYIVK